MLQCRGGCCKRGGQVKGHLGAGGYRVAVDQQERMIWFERRLPIASIVMDSFAELTDQRFRHRARGMDVCLPL